MREEGVTGCYTWDGPLFCNLCTRINHGKLVTRLYDKSDDFNCPIVNFPYLNIPLASA